MKLIATKAYSYNTRRLRAGDEFEANEYWARVLVGARRASYAQAVREEAPKPVARVVVPEPEPEDTGMQILMKLRAQAERLGIDVDGRWGAARLQQEIAQANRR
jgi:hypothetical protein